MTLSLAAERPASHPIARITGHPHLPSPETRARVVGYLSHAVEPAPGFRTDGAWVWPASMAEHIADHGWGAPAQLLDHVAGNGFLIPDGVAPEVMDEAAGRVLAAATPPPAVDATYLVSDDPADAPVLRVLTDRSGASITEAFTPRGWVGVEVDAGAGRSYERSAGAEAATRLDELCRTWHLAQLVQAQESAEPPDGVRLARMFDGAAPSGLPWFSPSRLRLIDPVRRERVAGYLSAGRLVVRSVSGMADPLSAAGGAMVPLGFRTDGAWVWQEGLAHYVRSRGAAPELALLTHIEERAYQVVEDVTDEAARMAVDAVRRGPLPRPERIPFAYYSDPADPDEVIRVGGGTTTAERLGPDLRWVRGAAPGGTGAGMAGLLEITEEDAVRTLDRRWSRLVGGG